MRLGLLGPADGDLAALERGARVLLDRERAERVIYLGQDDALDRVVLAWAERLVGGDPSEAALWGRSLERCATASAAEIDRFVGAERSRERLKALECLPKAPARTVEMFDGKLAVIVWDKALLDEEDIMPATLLVFGKSGEPVIRKVGARTFVSPGPLGAAGGLALLDDDPASGGIRVAVLDAAGGVKASDVASTARAGKMRVMGGPSV